MNIESSMFHAECPLPSLRDSLLLQRLKDVVFHSDRVPALLHHLGRPHTLGSHRLEVTLIHCVHVEDGADNYHW